MPVESEPAVAEIHFHRIPKIIIGKSTRMISIDISSRCGETGAEWALLAL